MGLKELMAKDNRVILRKGGHSERCTLTSDDGTLTGSISVIPGLIQENFLTDPHGNNDQQRADLWMSLSDTICILKRNPRRGDTFTFTAPCNSPAYVGIWTVQSIKPDNGDAVTCTCQNEQIDADAGHSALKVDG